MNAALQEMRSQHDALASHIFVSRRTYQSMSDTKSGKRHATFRAAQLAEGLRTWFRGELREWERLMAAASCRD